MFDPIRKKWVKDTPEEIVRQNVIRHLLEIGYPASLLRIEMDLKSFPSLSQVPLRRVDIACFASKPSSFELSPILLIECKAKPIGKEAIKQIIGYNKHIQAAFFTVVEGNKMTTFWTDNKGNNNSCSFIPTYKDILNLI